MSLLSISAGENQLIVFKPRLSVVDENDNEIDNEQMDLLSTGSRTDQTNYFSTIQNNNRVSFKMPPSDATSSPLFGTKSRFNDVFALITQGNEKALKQAFYNTIAIVFILFVLASVAAVYLVLQPFLQPLLWATLIGSVLHPFKRKLTRFLRWWILDSQKRPLSFSVIKMPLSLVNYSVNSLVSIIYQYYKLLLFIFIALLSIHLALFYFTITTRLIGFSQSLVYTLSDIVVLIVDAFSPIILITIAIGHLILNCITPPSIAAKMINVSFPITFVLLVLKITQIMGTLGLMIMFVLSSITLAGVLSSFFGISDPSGDETDSTLNANTIALVPFLWSFIMSLLPSSGENSSNPSIEQESPEIDSPDSISPIEEPKDTPANIPLILSTKKSPSRGSHFERRQSHVNCSNTSTTYIYAVFWSCLLAQLWLRPHILYLIPVIAALFMLTKFWKMLNGKEVINRWASVVVSHLSRRMTPSHHAIIQRIKYYYMIGDDTMANLLLKSLDSLCSALSIFTLTILVLFAVVFLSIQVYQESVHLVELTGSMMNSTLAYSPQLAKAFPVGFLGNNNLVDEMIANAYVYGRQWLQKSIRSALNVGPDANNNASISVEKQLIEVWDRVYHQWLIRNTNSTSYELNNRSFEAYNWNRLFAALQTLDFALCFNLLKENLDTVFSIFDSVWILLKSNLTLLFTLITAALSLILSGSSAILNCCLNLIIFATSLFYLLCSSGDEYKPVELAARFLPDSDRKGNYLNKFGQAVEESVNSVFAASFKMTVFYGLYTWLIHTLFEVKIIYIPSVLAALFGAVPFIGAYWASIPAVLELYLVHNLGGRALLMVFFALLPSYFVDSEIYSDIKGGGHPYLTGLAIAGGIFYLGFSGAFLGPMILACLFVAGKLYTSIMADSSGTKDTGFNLRSLRPHLKRMNTTTDL